MNKNFTPLVIVVIFFITSLGRLRAQNTLLHYWHFNNFTYTGAPVSIVTFPLDSVDADYSLFSSVHPNVAYRPITGTSAAYLTYWDTVSGDIVNQQPIAGIPTPAGRALRLRNPSDSMQLLFRVPSTGYKNINFSFAYQLSSIASGPSAALIDYSIDGGKKYIKTGLSSDSLLLSSIVFAPLSFSISNSAADDNSKLILRIRHSGSPQISGTKGNCRYDNVAVMGTAIGGLPVQLLSFDAFKQADQVIINWSYTNPVNVKNFILEKSINAKEFNYVETINPSKAQNAIFNLSYTDKLTNAQIVYYRLKTVNDNASYQYSNIVTLKNIATLSNLTITPNPVLNNIVFTHTLNAEKSTVAIIYTAEGKIVTTLDITNKKGNITIPSQNLPSGNYFLQVQNQLEKATKPFVKQ